MENKKNYEVLYRHYEDTLKKHGLNHKGMDWPKEEDLIRRFKVMLGLIVADSNDKIKLLDLGCGIGLFYGYLKENVSELKIDYHGIDISNEMIKGAQQLYPNGLFEVRDVLLNPIEKNGFDYIIMNGVMTEKVSLTQLEMIEFSQTLIKNVFESARVGIAFNVMSSHVDWKRDDLFHWDIDDMLSFLVKNCSRNIKINMDYGLYEHTVYVYKKHNY